MMNSWSTCIIRAAKGVGKSALAEEYARQVESAYLLDAESFLRGDRWYNSETNPADQEIEHLISLKKPCIIDNAEALLSTASPLLLNKLFHCAREEFPLIWIRNRLVNEEGDGWYATREKVLRTYAKMIDLLPDQKKIEVLIDQTFIQLPDWERGLLREWFMHWTGGSLGLYTMIKPYRPKIISDKSDLPREFNALVQQLIKEHLLNNNKVKTIFSVSLSCSLPAMTLLLPEYQETLGRLQALGIIKSSYQSGENPFCAHFWYVLAEQLTTPMVIEGEQKAEDIALILTESLNQINRLDDLANELACDSDQILVALAIKPSLLKLGITQGVVDIWAQLFGRFTLNKLAKKLSISVSSTHNASVIAK